MCFAIPYKITAIKNRLATIEDGRKILLAKNLKVKKGEYLQVTGNICIDKMSIKKAKNIRKLIKEIYSYE